MTSETFTVESRDVVVRIHSTVSEALGVVVKQNNRFAFRFN